MMSPKVHIEPSWRTALEGEFVKPYFAELSRFVDDEYKVQSIYPDQKDIFRAFDLCSFDDVKVVIIGQDPYHGPNQANGLCFAVHDGIKVPPSLKNIYKEISVDTGVQPFETGDLSRWAKQGVLLLNATLTVRAHTPGSHQKKGWELFTDAVIEKLSKEKEHLVFLLWGNYAKQKGVVIDRTKHLVLEAQHPSPFSAHNGFFGSKHFSKTNAYLKKQGKGEVNWI
ncbi:MAG: Uracil-DNA glycosylase [Candidatus Parcubacteria bacterium]|jgi:uracil-DNA glycosylase